MPTTFEYVFSQGTAQDTIDVTVSTPANNSTGSGTGFPVTSITGSIDGVAITGEVGTGGNAQQIDNFGQPFDNTIFTADSQGVASSPSSISSGGIDTDGLEFTVGSTEYNLFFNNNVFFTNDGTTAVPLTLVSTTAPCYCPGTLILTERGEVPVEDLTVGDRVVTGTGALQLIRWLGRRAYGARFARRNPALSPVCFRAGSLGEGVPRRDLFVSPKHAMFLDGVLVPAWLLVNGTSISQVERPEATEYLHVELDEHAVIWAEGAASESFLDDGSRGLFHNAAEFDALYPDHRAKHAGYCAPRVEDGEALEEIRRAIQLRAASLGQPVHASAA